MEVLLDVLRLLAAVLIAFAAGKLVARLKLPSILGWLIAGMIIGPPRPRPFGRAGAGLPVVRRAGKPF